MNITETTKRIYVEGNAGNSLEYRRYSSSNAEEVLSSKTPIVFLPDDSVEIDYRVWFRVVGDSRMHKAHVTAKAFENPNDIIEKLNEKIVSRHQIDYIYAIQEVLGL